MKRRAKIAPRSKKMAAKYVERRKLVARLLAERPRCEAGVTESTYGLSPATGLESRVKICTGRSQDIHEILSRARGGSILDETNCLAVCRACHTYITDHPAEAEALGLSKRRWPREDK